MEKTEIKKLERINKRLQRKAKAGRKNSAFITPFPISNAVFGDEVKGVVLQYMFPCEGKITKGAIDIGKKPKQDVVITLKLLNDEGGESKIFALIRKRLSTPIDVKVKEFDKVTISIDYNSDKPEDNIKEVWTSFLWVPTTRDVEVKSFMVSELEKALEEK